MIRGCQRKIILLNGGESSLFESAYFVLKKDIESGASHTDMVREANRIIESSLPKSAARLARQKKLRGLFCGAATFICGTLFGGGAFWFLFALFD